MSKGEVVERKQRQRRNMTIAEKKEYKKIK